MSDYEQAKKNRDAFTSLNQQNKGPLYNENLETLTKKLNKTRVTLKGHNNLEMRAKLSVAKNFKSLKYIPAKRGGKNQTRTPHYYVAKLVDSKRDKFELDYDWVEANFDKEFLLSVKAVQKNDGFIKIPYNTKCEQYSKAIYNAEQQKFFVMRENCRFKYEAHKIWMRKTFPAEYVDELKRRSTSNRFLRVPVGDSKTLPSREAIQKDVNNQ